MVYLRSGPDDFIELFTGGEPAEAPGNRAAGIRHVCLWVDDIDATLATLKSRGLDVDPTKVRTGRSRCRQYFIADPDGVRIELMQLMPDSEQARALA
jgi:lactoylglutathione lyase